MAIRVKGQARTSPRSIQFYGLP